MSANLDLVRSVFAAWERGDFGSTKWAHPEIEYVFTDGPAPGVWTGAAGMEEASRDRVSAWEGWHADAEGYRELDSERVFVFMRYGGRGKMSGFDLGKVRSRAASLWHVHDGKVTKLVCWWDRDRALGELGLDAEADCLDS